MTGSWWPSPARATGRTPTGWLPWSRDFAALPRAAPKCLGDGFGDDLGDGLGDGLGNGGVRQVIVEFHNGYLFVSRVRGGFDVGVSVAAGCDLGAVGYEVALLVERLGESLTLDIAADPQEFSTRMRRTRMMALTEAPPTLASAKILVAGGAGAGKSTFVETITEIPSILADQTTPLTRDFGRITVDRALRLYLFGTPAPGPLWLHVGSVGSGRSRSGDRCG